MQTLDKIADLRRDLDTARGQGLRIGLVPTMGFFHEGHVSLIEAAVHDCDFVVTTIFVNPLQFSVGEDLDAYPRDAEGDAALAAGAGCDLLFVPLPGEMYPSGSESVLTSVSLGPLAETMEGRSRPTHFAGVATVVTKLFFLIGECSAYFGEKDYQQLAVIRQMARDLSAPVNVVGCPVIREPDGLAMSTRNVYLSVEERDVAPVLNRALSHGAVMISDGERDAERVRTAMAALIDEAPVGTLDYVEVADPGTLEHQSVCSGESRLFGAVQFGRARLIDNISASDVSGDDDFTRKEVTAGNER